eukprot:m.118865 g.118865  ORF g.118865 m.118865 type:complete len:452 (+) comp28705_c0_seq2:133-1488(+)
MAAVRLLLNRWHMRVPQNLWPTHANKRFKLTTSLETLPKTEKLVKKGGVKNDSLEVVKEQALAGNPVAQNKLGSMYYHGKGVERNDALARQWFKLSAAQGHAAAQKNVGQTYYFGRGGVQDDTNAFKWFKLAADNGNIVAQRSLGNLYFGGRGVPQDDKQAFYWHTKAADRGNPQAMSNLGFMHSNGRGVHQCNVKAAEWYRKAAEKGYARAQCNLAFMLSRGLGVEENESEAIDLLRSAAEQGDTAAQYALGNKYASGTGVEQCDNIAAEWYSKAAKKGHGHAKLKLGNKIADDFDLVESSAEDLVDGDAVACKIVVGYHWAIFDQQQQAVIELAGTRDAGSGAQGTLMWLIGKGSFATVQTQDITEFFAESTPPIYKVVWKDPAMMRRRTHQSVLNARNRVGEKPEYNLIPSKFDSKGINCESFVRQCYWGQEFVTFSDQANRAAPWNI